MRSVKFALQVDAMTRYSKKQYRRHMFALMLVYVALVLLEWPYARSTANLPWKIVLALVPVVPVIAVIWLQAVRVMHSDELQQRLCLIALSVATGVVAAASMIGGFLCASHVLAFDGDVLIWVVPALCLVFGLTHVVISRRYGLAGCE